MNKRAWRIVGLILLFLWLLLPFACATEEQPLLTNAQLRAKSSTELRKLIETAYVEITAMNVDLSTANERLGDTKVELSKAHENYDKLFSFAQSENLRANGLADEVWRQGEKIKQMEIDWQKDKQKLFMWRVIGAGLVAIVVFFLALQFTSWLVFPPLVFGVPTVLAVGAAATVWLLM